MSAAQSAKRVRRRRQPVGELADRPDRVRARPRGSCAPARRATAHRCRRSALSSPLSDSPRLVGRGAQSIGMRQPGLLSEQLDVLARRAARPRRSRRGRTAVGRPPGPAHAAARSPLEQAAHLARPSGTCADRPPCAASSFGAAEQVEALALAARVEQLLLVGLPVDHHEIAGQLRQQSGGYAGPAGDWPASDLRSRRSGPGSASRRRDRRRPRPRAQPPCRPARRGPAPRPWPGGRLGEQRRNPRGRRAAARARSRPSSYRRRSRRSRP